MAQEKQILLQADEVQRTISRMAHEILEKQTQLNDLVIIGIRNKGAHLAQRIARKIEELRGFPPVLGIINVTAYRDDIGKRSLGQGGVAVEKEVSVDGKTVVLVDDVIYTGRTVRAAMDLLGDMGNPKKILLAILVDRSRRELPIRADIVGKTISVTDAEKIHVLLQEADGVDQIHSSKDWGRG